VVTSIAAFLSGLVSSDNTALQKAMEHRNDNVKENTHMSQEYLTFCKDLSN